VTADGVQLSPDVALVPALQANAAWNVIGPFSGDVSGTQQNISVLKLQGANLDLTGASAGQVLTFNGTSWIASAIPATAGPAGPTGSAGAPGVQGPQGVAGLAGTTGPAGAPGARGPTGATGSQGAPSATILSGATSPTAAAEGSLPTGYET
jgi:hypothetical protein